MSALFPELDKKLVNRILRDGVVLAEDEPASGTVLNTISSLGIVTKNSKIYVRCANREDPDYRDCPDKNCPGLVYIDEGANTYSCPECGRPVYQVENKYSFTEYLVEINKEVNIPSIKKYIRRVFLKLDLVETIVDDKGGGFQVTLSDNRPLSLCLLDEAEAIKQDTLYIQVSPRAKSHAVGLHVIELADFLSQSTDEIKAQWSQQLDTLLLTTHQQDLLEILADNFTLEEIKELCFKLNIEYEDLSGEERRAKARELISYLSRRDRLSALVTLIKKERPNINLV